MTTAQMAVAEKGLMVLDCTAEGKSGHAARELDLYLAQRIRKKMEAVIGGFHFETVREAEERLSIPRP